jgi:ABC-type Fe3+/spermidine/putrescine transport system ATPase subunit/ABC-type sulfate transport system permease component
MTRRRSPATLAVLASLLAIYLIAPFGAGLSRARVADWGSADLARRPGRAMALLGFIVQLPLALPPLASGVLLLFLLGYSSPLGQLTNGALTDSFTGIVLAEAFVAAPFLIIAARSAFAGIDPELEDVAATLGHRPWSVFLRVSLPLAWRATMAGLLLAWLRAFGEFGATVMVAYHPYSLPVFTYVAFGSEGLPAMMPVLVPTLLAAIAVMAGSLFFSSPALRRRSAHGASAANGPMCPDAPAMSVANLVGATPEKRGMDLDFAFRHRLDGFALDVAWRTSARRLAILGASGSGKSMTLRLIAGLDRAEAAALRLDGRDLSDFPPETRGIAYVPQSYGLFPNLPVSRQIRFPVDCDSARVRHWTARLGLTGLERRHPDELSLGQQQRVALARALSRRASLLLLDEPFSALDAPLRARLRRELVELQQELDATTIVVTHDPVEAALLADELLLLDAGHVLQSGPIGTVFLRPANEIVARLLGAVNIGRGRAIASDRIDVGNDVVLAVAGPPLPPGDHIGWSVRPEHIRFAPDAPYPARILNVGDVREGQRGLTVQLGEAVLHAVTDPGYPVEHALCRVAIDPQALQVWIV